MNSHAAHPRPFRKHVTPGKHAREFCLPEPLYSELRTGQTNKAVAPSTAFLVLCMTYLSRANDASQAASNQSCNGRNGEKLERKECKKV